MDKIEDLQRELRKYKDLNNNLMDHIQERDQEEKTKKKIIEITETGFEEIFNI